MSILKILINWFEKFWASPSSQKIVGYVLGIIELVASGTYYFRIFHEEKKISLIHFKTHHSLKTQQNVNQRRNS
jgi:hypothetical protein